MLTQERLQTLLSYDPNTGKFYWKSSRGSKKAYSEAGVLHKGYRYIKIDSVKYGAHRLAVMYMIGEFPPEDTDHINGQKDDNRWVNLRPVTRKQNAANAKLNKGNFLGIKNVRMLPDTKKFQVVIGAKSFGCYEDVELAELVATEVRNKLYGEYARHV